MLIYEVVVIRVYDTATTEVTSSLYHTSLGVKGEHSDTRKRDKIEH